ncbi:MAG: hypothetical protein U0736_01085 [Gemmataceae bacterium]
MTKKLLIAAAAVVVALVVVKGTWLGSMLRMKANCARDWVAQSVPPEEEIQRLRMELRSLEKEDDKHYDGVARMAVQVEKLDREVGQLRANLTGQEARIRKLRTDLGARVEFVTHDGSRYTRDDLRADAISFKVAEDSLKSKEANLQAKKRHLVLERKKLSELRTTRETMSTELQRLETALAEERHAQAASESTIDDSSYQKLRKDMDSVRDRIEVLKKKRELRGEFRPAPIEEKVSERDVQADKYLDARFGKPAQEVVDGK